MLLNDIGAEFCYTHLPRPDPKHETRIIYSQFHFRRDPPQSPAKKQSICTADELHRVSIPNSDWKVALWRYLPSPKAPLRNHPLLLLSGVATNAIGYDLSPESSFARYMSAQGFDTWTLEVRGTGLSTYADSMKADEECLKNSFEEVQLTTGLIDIFTRMSDRPASILRGDFLERRQNFAILSQIKNLNRRLQTMIEGQRIFPPQILELSDRFISNLEEFQNQLELIVKYDWDFDHYLEEDVPSAIEYIKAQCQPKDGKLLAIGHSMGGILLYAMLSCYCFDGKESVFASIVTLASSLDYTPSRSSLKLLSPSVEPVRTLNVPVIPVGPLISSLHPLSRISPYLLSWLYSHISVHSMDQKLFEKLVLNSFCTVPSKLILQLKTVLQNGGLRDRKGTFFYKDHLHKSQVPVLAMAGDKDLICPPEAVYETVKLFSKEMVTYKVFGESGGPHYAHYDLVVGRSAAEQLYPCITEFLTHHDMA